MKNSAMRKYIFNQLILYFRRVWKYRGFVALLVAGLFVVGGPNLVSARINIPDYVFSNEYKQLNNIYFYEKNVYCLPGTQFPGGDSTATAGATGDASQSTGAVVYNFLLGKGLSPVQALGVLGNLMRESGGGTLNLDATAVNSIGATGIAQWLGGRKTNLINYASGLGLSEFNLQVQMDFMWQELTTSYKKSTLDPLLATTDLKTATEIFLKKYEIPGHYDVELPVRYENALEVAQQLGVDINSSTATTPTAGISTSSTDINCTPVMSGEVTLVGDKAFPLAVSKDQILNPNDFYIDTHENYTAYDILVAEGNKVVAYMSGKVISAITTGGDRCGGGIVSIYNTENNLTVTYMHMSSITVSVGQEVSAGDQIGITGDADDGCGVAHLHIDAISGEGRPGCSRLGCSVPEGSFTPIGDDLKNLYDSMGTEVS